MTDTTANTLPIFAKNPRVDVIEIAPADTTTLQTLFVAGTEGSTINNISVTSSDTSDILLHIRYNDGTGDRVLGKVTVPAGSGNNGTLPTLNLLATTALAQLTQADGSLPVGISDTIKVNCQATMATGILTVIASGGDY